MTDRPIIFSAPMVLALLAGRKTQTRRLAKGTTHPTYPGSDDLNWRPSLWRNIQLGDRLYVREAFAIPSNWTGPMSRIAASCEAAGWTKPWAPVHYLADGERANWGDWRGHEHGNGRPSIHMPRWASRLTLTVTDVRVQRLFDITEDDARDEGCWTERAILETATRESVLETAVHPSMVFRLLWNDIHGPGAWADNPEVVALTFTVARRNIDD